MNPSWTRELARAVSSEMLKIRRTLALRLALLAPLFIVLLQLGVYFARGQDRDRETDPLAGFARGILTLWTLVFLPFYATLAASLVASLDHQDRHWDRIFALPIRRAPVFAAKWIVTVSLVLLSSLALPVFTLAAAGLLRSARHEWAAFALPAGMLFDGTARAGAAALLLVSLQFWSSTRWRAFIPALAVGIAGIMSGIILISAPLHFLSLYPWTAPAAAASPSRPVLALLWGSFGGLFAGIAACRRLARREL